MTKAEMEKLIITEPSEEWYRRIRQELDHIAKPIDGLGIFEHYLAQIGAIQEQKRITIDKKAILVMCADNGIVEEHVSQSGQEITRIVAEAMGKNLSSVGRMAGTIDATVIPIDIGINSKTLLDGVMDCKVSCGTKNFLMEPAMAEEEMLQAIQVGITMVEKCKQENYNLLATGEMGIGNTTTATAIAAVLLQQRVSDIIGRGAGLDDQALRHKEEVIESAIEKYHLRGAEVWTVLQSVGGLDIAGMMGLFLGAAIYRIPILIDGVISAVSAFLAEMVCPGCKKFMIPSHRSKEKVSELILEQLQLHAPIDASMALGEGTGAVMMMSLLDVALSVYQSCATFQDYEMEEYRRFS